MAILLGLSCLPSSKHLNCISPKKVLLLYHSSGLFRLLRNPHSSITWHAECVSTSRSNEATDIGLSVEDGVDMCCYWVRLLQRCGEYNEVSRTHIPKDTWEWNHDDIWRFGTNMEESYENLIRAISTISQPSFAKRIHKTTRWRFWDLSGRALVSVYFLHAKQRFYVVTCLDSTAVKTRTPKTVRTIDMRFFSYCFPS